MQNTELKNRDHSYSEVNLNSTDDVVQIISDDDTPALFSKRSILAAASNKETFGQVKDINELKKITPRVKLLAHDANSLTQLTKITLHNKIPAQTKLAILEQTKEQLNKYCRTCAGLKLPLVDIFGEKGIQMRLSQQIRHLEQLNPRDSLSTQMCMDCICDLKMSYKFFMQIKKAEVKLKSMHHTLIETATKNMQTNKMQSSKNIESSEQSFEKVLKSNKTLASTSKDYEQNRSSPKISVNISSKHNSKLVKEVEISDKEIEMYSEAKVESEPEIFNIITIQTNSDDNESIEEFDPDDPPFQPDSSDALESDDETESGVQNGKKRNIQRKEITNIIQEHTQPVVICDESIPHNATIDLNQTVYKYDMTLNAYVKIDDIDENNSNTEQTIIHKPEITVNTESTKEYSKQPNILKRRLLPHIKKEATEDAEGTACILNVADMNEGEKDFKVQKLDVHNPLSINNSEEDGIMYVTVKGSKPNELLLVKVKKMDKSVEKREEKVQGKKGFEIKPVDRILKRYDTQGTKEKDLFSDKVKQSDIREQIIEEQIEEYKKKREKVLGGQTNVTNSLRSEESRSRHYRRYDVHESSKSSAQVDNNPPIKVDLLEDLNDCSSNVIDQIDEVSENVELPKDKPTDEKLYVNTEEYLSRLAKLKLKWEEAKKKKESLQKELDESYTEGNIEKLARILGEKEKNLQDFQEFLKQRKIVITRLKDEDIISLYEDRNNSALKNSLPDLIDEAQPTDYIPEENYLECDYCPETFASKEVLEEHLKIHDYKLTHYCEDCKEQFPTNKAKRNHNVVCIQKLICKYCDLILESKGKKRQHEQKHCDSMYGQLCDVCGEKFKHQGTLDQHVKTQHMSWEKIYQCPKCPKKFAFKQKLSFHLKSVHTTLRAYLCEDCGADFKNPASLRHHRIRKHQPVGNKRECPVCHKLVPFYSLSKHMHTHKAYTIQCPHCDKMFKNSSTLKQHVRIHEDQRQYRCDTCGVGFNRRDGLRLHMRVHEKSDSRGLKECSCQVCGEKFPNHSTLVIHRNRVHKDGRQYTCHICNRSMISTRSLEWHMSHIHNESVPGIVREDVDGAPDKKRVSCYHCNKTFKTEMILRTHIKNTHMEKDPMKCLDCELTFTSEVRLRHHMMVTHNRLEGTLPCPHCPKRFVNQLRLKTHMISHSEERPYTCEICGFNLKTKIQLIKHHQNRHSDERPLQCRYCPWRCKQVSALVCHERTHTNERPYSCSVCRQRFKYLGDKNKHERRHESLGGSGFKRIVLGRNIKPKIQEDSSCSDQEQEGLTNTETQLTEEQYEEQTGQQYEDEEIVKFKEQEITQEEYEQVYEQEYEETSREASDAAEVIMNMEDTTVYTEEVTADNIESAEIMADEMMTSEILQSGTVVHLQQEDDSGKIQVIPVMLSLPDLSDANTEVNLATASIMYNN